MCGEQAMRTFSVPVSRGSPPRVRGTGVHADTLVFLMRITPACAGNSPRQLDIAGWRRDHPRVCGEQSIKEE